MSAYDDHGAMLGQACDGCGRPNSHCECGETDRRECRCCSTVLFPGDGCGICGDVEPTATPAAGDEDYAI